MIEARWSRPRRSRALLLPIDDVDTDQIIPARFLTSTSRDGLGAHLFADRRRTAAGDLDPAFPLTGNTAGDRRILVAGRNFGCGSSREHAPWALLDFGIEVVIATSFGDIFRANALKNALLPVQLDAADWQWLVGALREDPAREITVDLRETMIAIEDWRAHFPIDPFARECLLEGVDELGYLLARSGAILGYEGGR